jgi:hypothetical protein
MTTGRAPVNSIKTRAARTYGRALLTADQRADARATCDDGSRARLATEARMPAPTLTRSHWNNRRGEDHKA